MENIHAAKSVFDVGGHYFRPDIIPLRVNRKPYTRIVEATEFDPGKVQESQ